MATVSEAIALSSWRKKQLHDKKKETEGIGWSNLISLEMPGSLKVSVLPRIEFAPYATIQPVWLTRSYMAFFIVSCHFMYSHWKLNISRVYHIIHQEGMVELDFF
jgi:hypothetical protein